MRKRDRLQLVETLIREQRLSTQAELVAALAEAGCPPVTQATISRDMRELGVQKGIGRDGKVGYVLPPPEARRDPATVLARVLGESGATVKAAQNLVVVRSQPGTAPAVGLAIDGMEHEEIVGTVAGDDTVLLVLPDAVAAQGMVELLTGIVQA